MIIVVEGPSAAGKTTWCRRHAPVWLAEPGRWPMERVLRYQVDRWHRAVAADARGEVVVLDGDPFKLYYLWAQRRAGDVDDETWRAAVATSRQQFADGELGLADLVLYLDPGETELRRRKEADRTRTRRNFARNTAMRRDFRRWFEAVASLDPERVIWDHPENGITTDLLAPGRRPSRSDPDIFDQLLDSLAAGP